MAGFSGRDMGARSHDMGRTYHLFALRRPDPIAKQEQKAMGYEGGL